VKHTEQFREHVRDIMIHRDVLRATYTDFLLAKALREGIIGPRTVLDSGVGGRCASKGRLLEDDVERAAEHYIRFVAPKESVVRTEIMTRVRQSIDKNRKLLELLAACLP
jgi:hypothetical protein